MLVFIRHGEKSYNNSQVGIPEESFKHDPPLTEDGYIASRDKGIQLLDEFGIPDYIIISPYERCRQTADSILKGLASKDVPVENIKIYVDTTVSEYLGNHPTENLHVTSKTSEFNPPHPETFSMFCKRVNRCYEFLTSNYIGKKVWIITHGLVMSRIYRLAHNKGKQKFKYLEHMFIGA
jgi:broad specificity phosphatase PhoE